MVQFSDGTKLATKLVEIGDSTVTSLIASNALRDDAKNWKLSILSRSLQGLYFMWRFLFVYFVQTNANEGDKNETLIACLSPHVNNT